MDKPAQIALLIDADNATAARIDVILDELSSLGETNIRRAYGNWTKTGLKSWQEVLHENAIRPVQQFDVSKGKNASDIALAVDAVEILHTQRPGWFALASSDADFTPLVMHLREHGASVYGFGDAKTPEPFQSACTRFLVLNRLALPGGRADPDPADAPAPDAVTADAAPTVTEEAPPAASTRRRATATATNTSAPMTAPATVTAAKKKTAANSTTAKKTAAKATAAKKTAASAGTAEKAVAARSATGASGATAVASETPGRFTRNQLRSDTKLVALLRRAVEGAADDAGWASVSSVGQRISNQSSFDSRNYGYARLSKLLEATDLFELRTGGASGMAVRDRRTSTNGTTTGNA